MNRFKLAVPVLALFAVALVGRAAEAPADTIVVNAKVLTVDANFSRASAVAIRGDKFVAVGSEADIRKLAGPSTKTIDAGGRTVIPGLVEGHLHATQAARGDAQQPYQQLYSIGEIKEWVRARAKEAGPGGWIQLPRTDVTRIKERRLPNKADLDEAAPNNPAVFTWQYANKIIQILNSAALKVTGINSQTEVPPGGKIHFGASGEPTGTIENASGLVTKFVPARGVTDEKYHDMLVKLLHNYNAIGITSIGERGANVAAFETYNKLKAQGRLTTRVTVTIMLNTDGTVAGTERVIKAIPHKTGDGDDWVKIGPLKLGVDGGILYATAHMREPYGPQSFSLYGISDPNYRGDLRISREELKNIIRTGHRLGWQMSSHVTGDAGVDAVLEAVEASNADGPVAPRRYNLIHGYFPNPETAAKAARLGVAVDIQPMWYYKDGDALAEALGPKRLEHFIGLQSWQKAGVKVAINADHMQGIDPNTSLNPYNPFLAMQTAITRKTESGQIFGPEERVSREDALRMVTINAAWFSFDEKKVGSIEVGKYADLAILTDDYLACPEDKIKDIRSRLTMVGGKIVHEVK
jgi:predicted amidohydrolase YtcJ